MAKYILKRSLETNKLKVADDFITSANTWLEKAKEDHQRALKAIEDSKRHERYAHECLEEAAKLLGFKNPDELNVYIAVHGAL